MLFPILKRLAGFCAAVALLGPLSSFGQTGASKEPEPIRLAVAAIGLETLPTLLCPGREKPGDGKGKVVLNDLPVGEGRAGPTVQIPFAPGLEIYSGAAGTKDPAEAKSFAKLPEAQPGEFILLLLYLDAAGKPAMHFVKENKERHAAAGIRAVNLTSRRIAVRLGDAAPVPVVTGTDQFLVPTLDEKGRFAMQYFEERPGSTPAASPVKRSRFPSADSRLLLVYVPMRVNDEPSGAGKLVTTEVRLFQETTAAGPSAHAGATPAPGGTGRSSLAGSKKPAELHIFNVTEGDARFGAAEVMTNTDPQATRRELAPRDFVLVPIPPHSSASVRLPGWNNREVARVNFPSQGGRQLVVLAAGDSAGDEVRAAWFDDSMQSHPQGEGRIFNITPFPMAYSTGGPPNYVDPKQSSVVAAAADARLKIAVQVQGKWRLVSESEELQFLPGTRGYFFVAKTPDKDDFFVVRKVQ